MTSGCPISPPGRSSRWRASPTVYVVAYASAKSRIETVAEQEYNTFRRVGTFVQVVSLEIAGPNAPKLTSSHIKGVNGLTRTLGANWAW